MMNVFDDEMGPLCPLHEAERIVFLAASGLSLDELRAWERLVWNRAVERWNAGSAN